MYAGMVTLHINYSVTKLQYSTHARNVGNGPIGV